MTDSSTSFSDEEHRKFQRLWDLAEGDDVDIDEKFDMFDQYFTTPESAAAYNRWCRIYKESKTTDPPSAVASASQPGPQEPDPQTFNPAPIEVYQDKLKNVNFSNPHDVAGLNELLNCGFHPHIPIGHVQGGWEGHTVFRLVPNTSWLSPTKEKNCKHDDDREVVPPMILGINHTVILNKLKCYNEEEIAAIDRYIDDSDYHTSDDESAPEVEPEWWEEYHRLVKKVESFSTPDQKYGKYGIGSRPQDLSKQVMSTEPGDATTPNDQTVFVFYQLGVLQSCNTLDDPTTTEKDAISSHDWYRTDWILVAQIESTGNLGAIWVLWNFWNKRDDDGQRIWTEPLVFPGTDESITGARIADSFAELGAAREIRFPTGDVLRFTEDFELVRCVRLLNEGNRIVRQWVVDSAASDGNYVRSG